MRLLPALIFSHPALSLGSTVLWGLLEFVALQRSRLARMARRQRHPAR